MHFELFLLRADNVRLRIELEEARLESQSLRLHMQEAAFGLRRNRAGLEDSVAHSKPQADR